MPRLIKSKTSEIRRLTDIGWSEDSICQHLETSRIYVRIIRLAHNKSKKK